MPDSVRIMNSWEGTWRAWRGYADSYWDTLSSGDEMKWVSAQWKMANGETSATAIDSIILDTYSPTAYICTPTDSDEVNGEVTFWGSAHDGYTYFRVDTLRYFRNTSYHDTIHVSWEPIGGMMMGELGTWSTYSVPNGWTRETLAVWDSAGNSSYTYVNLHVYNKMDDGDGFAAGFGSFGSAPMNLVTDPNGNLIVAETQGSTLRAFSAKKDTLFSFSARRGDSTGLNWAVGMASKDSTTLYVADGYGHCIKAFDRQGNLLLRFGSYGTGQGLFRQPCGIALDHKGRVFVVDRLNHRVQVFTDTSGQFLFQFGSQGRDSGKMDSPTGIAISPNGVVYVSDTKNHRIQVYDSLGKWKKSITRPDSLGFDTPLGLCTDKRGNLYVADGKHHRIVKLSPFGQSLFVFGKEGDSLWQFKNPIGVASSPGGRYLYVADAGHKRVTRFTVVRGDTTGGGPQFGEAVPRIPLVNFLGPAYPNPTKGEVQISYGLAKESPVSLKIYNVAGQMVREINQGKQKAGYYSISWDGRSNLGHRVGAGVYFYRLEAGSWAKTRKMVVIR
jgi:DNA-binding beta-propeller fold protein YncE